MSSKKYLFSSESVTEGHPDKVCDQISDAILDELLKQDKNSRVAVESVVTTGLVAVVGEVTTKGYVEFQKIVRDVIRDIGYDKPEYLFDYRSCGVIASITSQSPDIAIGVDATTNKEQGAGDQGIMVGYACDENPAMIPQELYLAKSLCRFLYDWNPQDGKTQITLDDDGKIMTIVASWARTTSIDLRKRFVIGYGKTKKHLPKSNLFTVILLANGINRDSMQTPDLREGKSQ
jgi:S-adenosylmethionine synthetase